MIIFHSHFFYVLWQVLYNTDKSLVFVLQQNKSGETNTSTTVLINMYFTITCN